MTIQATGRGPEGAALKPGTSVDGIDLELGEGRLQADALRSFRGVPVGKSTVRVVVSGADGGSTGIAEIAVVRLDAALTDPEERLLYFRTAAMEGKAEPLSRAIEAGADVDVPLAIGKQRASALIGLWGDPCRQPVRVVRISRRTETNP